MKSSKRSHSHRAAALKYHQRASRLFTSSDPDRPDCRKKLKEALASAKRALMLDPDNYESLVLMGEIYFDLGDARSIYQAQECYDRAITLSPKRPDAYAGKANLMLYDLNAPDEAELLARKALRLSQEAGEDPELLEMNYIGLLNVLEARGKFASAKWLVRRALSTNPSDFMRGIANSTLKRMGY
jgi:cytochrome c-type biogenesis protein CcmH/NrfG